MRRRARSSGGSVSLLAVTAMAVILMFGLLMVYREGAIKVEVASGSQLQTDRAQREEVLLRELVARLPGVAAEAMRGGYDTEAAGAGAASTWDALFTEVIARATGSAFSPLTAEERLASRRGDVAEDDRLLSITDLNGVPGRVTPGIALEAARFHSLGLDGRVPPLLVSTEPAAEALMPVVGLAKRYGEGAVPPELLDPVHAWNQEYNRIEYPAIRFRYAEPDRDGRSRFVAKRNWWAFQVSYADPRGGPPRRKRYVLSLYEVPSQLPIEASRATQVGSHAGPGGTEQRWEPERVRLTGSVLADSLTVRGLNLTTGAQAAGLAGRRGVVLEEDVVIGGLSIGGEDADFDGLDSRYRLQVEYLRRLPVAQRAEWERHAGLPVGVAANHSRLSFRSLNPGPLFLRRQPPEERTRWDTYVRGANRCTLVVRVTRMLSAEVQEPSELEIRYEPGDGQSGQVLARLSRESVPSVGYAPWVAGATPFEPDGVSPYVVGGAILNPGRRGMGLHLGRVRAWVASLNVLNTAQIDGLHSMAVELAESTTGNRIRPPAFLNPNGPGDVPVPEDMCVVLREADDLRSFGRRGVSMVAPFRVYIGGDLNMRWLETVPPGSGLPAGERFYPPVALFAAEVRFGTNTYETSDESPDGEDPPVVEGQINNLSLNGATPWRPLDLTSGNALTRRDDVRADLKPLRVPAEVPFIHLMNWLVVVEELEGG